MLGKEGRSSLETIRNVCLLNTLEGIIIDVLDVMMWCKSRISRSVYIYNGCCDFIS